MRSYNEVFWESWRIKWSKDTKCDALNQLWFYFSFKLLFGKHPSGRTTAGHFVVMVVGRVIIIIFHPGAFARRRRGRIFLEVAVAAAARLWHRWKKGGGGGGGRRRWSKGEGKFFALFFALILRCSYKVRSDRPHPFSYCLVHRTSSVLGPVSLPLRPICIRPKRIQGWMRRGGIIG